MNATCLDAITYSQIRAETQTLINLVKNKSVSISSELLEFKKAFPIYLGEDFILINLRDREKAAEFEGCECFLIENYVFYPDTQKQVADRISSLYRFGIDYFGPYD